MALWRSSPPTSGCLTCSSSVESTIILVLTGGSLPREAQCPASFFLLRTVHFPGPGRPFIQGITWPTLTLVCAGHCLGHRAQPCIFAPTNVGPTSDCSPAHPCSLQIPRGVRHHPFLPPNNRGHSVGALSGLLSHCPS